MESAISQVEFNGINNDDDATQWNIFYFYNKTFHNGENDSLKRQLQLWYQIICQTKTAKKFLWNWLVILMSCNSLKNFEYEEAFAKPQLLKFGKKTSLP